MAASEEVASGYVSLYARMESQQVTNEVSKALSSALSGSAVSDALSSFSSFSTKAGAALTGGLLVAMHELPDLVGDFINTISTTESADLALTTMFTPQFEGDVDAAGAYADEYIDTISNFAMKTPFGFESALVGARTLIAMGYEGDEVLQQLDGDFGGVLNWAGNIASALGGDATTFNNIILQLGHMKSLGHVMSFQMNALARNGVPAWKALAEYINYAGVEIEGYEDKVGEFTVEDVRAATKAGAITSDVGISALQWYSETNYVGMMEKESHTLRGIMMNMADAIDLPIRTLYETDAWHGFSEAMYDMLDPLREFTTALLPTFELAFKKITPLVRGATDKLNGMAAALENGSVTGHQIISVIELIGGLLSSGPLLLAAGGVSSGLAEVAKVAEKASGSAGSAIADLFGTMNDKAKAGAGRLKKTFDKTRSMSKRFGAAMAKATYQSTHMAMEGGSPVRVPKADGNAYIPKHMAATPGVFEKLHRSIESSTGSVRRFASELGAATTKTDVLRGAFSKLRSATSTALSGSVLFAGAVAETGLSMFSSFSKAALAGSSIIGVIALVGVAAAGAFVAMGGDMKSLGSEVEAVLVNTGTLVSDVMRGLTDAFNRILDEGQMQEFFKRVTTGIETFLRQVSAAAPEFIEAFGEVFDQVLDGIVGMMVEFAPGMVGGAIQMFTGLIEGLTTIVGKLTEAMPDLLGGIMTAIVNNLPALVTAGVGLFSGLVNAFATVVPLVIDELPGLISSLSEAFENNKDELFGAAWFLFWTIVEAIPEIIPIAVNALVGLVTDLTNSIDASDEGEFGSKATDLLGQIGNAIGSAAPVALEAFGGLLLSLAGKIPEFVWDFFVGGASFIKNLVDGFLGGESVAMDSTDDVISDISDTPRSHFSEWKQNAIGWIVNAIAGLFSAKTALADEADSTVDTATNSMTSRPGEFVNAAIGWVGNLINGLLDGASTLANNIASFVAGAVNSFIGNSSDFAASAGEWISGLITGIWDGAVTIAGSILTFVAQVASSFIGNIDDFAQAAGEWVGGLISGIWQAAVTIAGEIVSFVADIVSSFEGDDGSFINAAGEWIANLITGLWQAATTIAGAILTFIGAVITSFIGNPQEFIDAAGEWLANMVSGITQNTESVLTEIGNSVGDAIGKAGEYAENWIAAGKQFLTDIATGVSDNVESFAGEVWGFIDGAISSIPILGDLWAAGKEAIGAIADGIMGSDDVYSSMEGVGKDAVAGLESGIEGDVEIAIQAAHDVTDELEPEAREVLESNSPSRVFKRIGEDVVAGLNVGIEGSDATKGLPGVKNSLTGFFSGSDTWLSRFGANMVGGLGSGIDGNKSAATDAMQAVKTAVSDKFSDAATLLKGKGTDVSGGFAGGISASDSVAKVKASVQSLRDSVTNKLSDAATLIKGKGTSVASGFGTGIGGNTKAVADAVGKLKTKATDALSNASTMLKDKGGNATTGFANGMNGWAVLESVKKAAQEVSNTAKGNISTNTDYIGTNFVQGIANGIWKRLYAVRDAVAEVNNSMSTKVMSFLGISSPSRVGISIGQYFVQGIAIGMDNMIDSVADSAAGVATSAVDAVNEEFAPGNVKALSVSAEIDTTGGQNASLIDRMTEAFARELSNVGVYLSANETASQLAPSMDRALGRLSYMGV